MKSTILVLSVFLMAFAAYGKKDKAADKLPDDLEKFDGPFGRPYYVLLPDNYDPEKRYWLYVLVHGHGGDGLVAASGKFFEHRDQCIFAGPTFPDGKTEGYYQELGGSSDKQLDEIVKEMKKKYKLHDRFMLQGHSGGSQFSHRYAMKNPDSVLACISTSGGTWGNPSSSAKCIPFLFSCGEKDTEKSVPTDPMGRLEWYRKFRDSMISGDFFYTTRVIPGEGHGATGFAKETRADLFLLASTGLWPNQREELNKSISEIQKMIESGNKERATSAIGKLSSFKPSSKPEYSAKPIDDTDEKERRKTHLVNEYGYTTNPRAEKYLADRTAYYLKNIVIPELSEKINSIKK